MSRLSRELQLTSHRNVGGQHAAGHFGGLGLQDAAVACHPGSAGAASVLAVPVAQCNCGDVLQSGERVLRVLRQQFCLRTSQITQQCRPTHSRACPYRAQKLPKYMDGWMGSAQHSRARLSPAAASAPRRPRRTA
jgi:hypothetical protein